MQRLNDALADFEQGMNVETLCAECFYGRGLIKYEKGDLEGASLDLATAAKLNPLSSKEFEEEGYNVPVLPPGKQTRADSTSSSR